MMELGSVVRLKSGGPKMVVTSVIEKRGEEAQELCRCMFFATDRMHEILVPAVALKEASDGASDG